MSGSAAVRPQNYDVSLGFLHTEIGHVFSLERSHKLLSNIAIICNYSNYIVGGTQRAISLNSKIAYEELKIPYTISCHSHCLCLFCVLFLHLLHYSTLCFRCSILNGLFLESQ